MMKFGFIEPFILLQGPEPNFLEDFLDNEFAVPTMPRHVRIPYNEGSEKISHPILYITRHRARRDDRGGHLDCDHERSDLRIKSTYRSLGRTHSRGLLPKRGRSF